METPNPGLKTRDKSKSTRPGVNAGVEKKSRRTPAEMQQARADDAKKRLAAVEDKQRSEDILYAETANHPTDRPKTANAAASTAAGGSGGGGDGDDSGSGDDDPYMQPSSEESSEESEPEDNSDEEQPKKKQKKKKEPATSRADIIASRNTRDGSGTPAVPADDSKKRKATTEKNAGKPKKKAKTPVQKKSGLEVKSKTGAQGTAVVDTDSMVAPGGPALDDDERGHVERPVAGRKKKGIPTAPAAPRPPTRRDLRGGAAKWKVVHLPPGTSTEFADEVVPLIHELVGTLKPWEKPVLSSIQDIVDRVFGKDKYLVTSESAWAGLVGYRLDSWRNGIGSQPHKFMLSCIENYGSEDEEDTEANDNGPLPPTTPTPDVPADAVPKAKKFKFDTPEGRAEFVAWALQHHDASGTNAFHWKIWGDGVDKKGFLQSKMILHAFAYHLACLEAIPGGYVRLEAHPKGAYYSGLLVFSEQGAEGTIDCIQCLPDELKNRRFEGTPDYSGLLMFSEQGAEGVHESTLDWSYSVERDGHQEKVAWRSSLGSLPKQLFPVAYVIFDFLSCALFSVLLHLSSTHLHTFAFAHQLLVRILIHP
ncbi:hypothetical protein B0H14DRAFT_3470230 [Mycena olivaceomarginata]|nr:hypothetical protein B0H14DRAFT_3470230 [Mycena olivaceomarginata]